MYRRSSDGFYPITLQQVRDTFPLNSSWPANDIYDGYDKVVLVDAPMPTQFQTVTEGQPTQDVNGQWNQVWTIGSVFDNATTDQLAAIKAQTLAQRISDLSDYRYSQEIKGITLPNGWFVPTDRESQSCYGNALGTMALMPTQVVQWGMPQGFMPLTYDSMKTVITAVFNWVQQCRSHEKDLYDQIQALAANTDAKQASLNIAAFDITVGW